MVPLLPPTVCAPLGLKWQVDVRSFLPLLVFFGSGKHSTHHSLAAFSRAAKHSTTSVSGIPSMLASSDTRASHYLKMFERRGT